MTILRRELALAGAGIVVLEAVLAAGIAMLGAYNVAADSPHTAIVRDLIGYIRERSVELRAASISVPPLADPRMIAAGASHYDAMCTGCHLAPGMEENEMRPGMNPKPPMLASLGRGDPREEFWIIKHGIKLTGMPAWGFTHTDGEIWNIVAFLQKMPSLSPEQYRVLTASAADHHAHEDHDVDHMDMSH
jgi:mono/diheme cytochrome c family protein